MSGTVIGAISDVVFGNFLDQLLRKLVVDALLHKYRVGTNTSLPRNFEFADEGICDGGFDISVVKYDK